MQDSGLSPQGGGGGRLIAKDIVDLHKERKYFATAINCSLAVTDQRCGWDVFFQIFCAGVCVTSWGRCRSVSVY